jgi:AcrR family transcriptional regulator
MAPMTDQPPTRRSRAQAVEQTRADLLAAGARLLREQPVGSVFTQVTAGEVARRAGRTIGAFYHHWPDQDSYRRELLGYVLAPERLPTSETAQDLAAGVEGQLPTEELLRRNARANLVYGMHRPEYAVIIAMWAQAYADEGVRELLRRQYDDVRITLLPVYAQLFAANGWVPRPPFTMETISVTVTALVEGFVLRAVVEPDAVPLALPDERGEPVPDDDSAWDLFSTVVLALLPMMTMPAEPEAGSAAAGVTASAADVRDLVRALWSAWPTPPDPA